MPLLSISRTIYDPSTKDFITSTPDAKAMPHIKKWINQHNPVIYWYILRIDNPSDTSIDQWAVELYAHQALSITEVHVDGIDRRFEVRKRERDPWSEKYVLSIPRQVGIPIIGKGTRRIFFKVDIDKFAPRFIKLCDALVELLHIEVMGAEVMDVYTPPPEPVQVKAPVSTHYNNNSRAECPTCRNLITESNKSLICTECKGQFCATCEEWFRDECKRGEGPLCEDCFTAEQERIAEEGRQKEKEEQDRKIREEAARKKQEEERIQKEKEEQERKAREEEERLEHERKEKAEQELLSKQKEEEERQRKQREEDEARLRKEKERTETLAKEANSVGMKFTHILAGEFMMGSPSNEKDRLDREGPAHKVTIRNPFYLGTYPVTQREWNTVMGNNPSHFKGDDLPVEKVSWDDIQEFIRKLNEKEGTAKYRLPSEAEWEYACRAGTTTKYCFGDSESKLGEYAWYGGNSGSKTHPVGKLKPNPWGLYDMHGNVWEWVQDKWHGDYDGAPTDGSSWGCGDSSSPAAAATPRAFAFCRSRSHFPLYFFTTYPTNAA